MKSRQVIICIILLLATVMLFAAEPQSRKDDQAFPASRDGSSFGEAVIIKYIGDYQKSIDQEYRYLETKFGIKGKDWGLVRQILINKEGRIYDEMIVELLPSKKTVTLYFDITEPSEEMSKQLLPDQK